MTLSFVRSGTCASRPFAVTSRRASRLRRPRTPENLYGSRRANHFANVDSPRQFSHIPRRSNTAAIAAVAVIVLASSPSSFAGALLRTKPQFIDRDLKTRYHRPDLNLRIMSDVKINTISRTSRIVRLPTRGSGAIISPLLYEAVFLTRSLLEYPLHESRVHFFVTKRDHDGQRTVIHSARLLILASWVAR